MQTYLEFSKAAQDQILETAKQNQKIAVQLTQQAAQAWAQTIAPYAGQIPPVANIEGMPTAEELVENSFGFAKKMLDAQHELAVGMTQAWAPVTEAARSKSKSKAPAGA